MKVLGFQPVESTSPFKVLVSEYVNLHPYNEDEADGDGDDKGGGAPGAKKLRRVTLGLLKKAGKEVRHGIN